ncbi:MAG: hypothetical protein PHC84_02080 [Clostridia bacterium]|nr:hypothetical protein [Clostridia bacterium]
MILREILNKTVEIIGDDDINLDTESKKRTRLLACANMIYHELTTEYVQLKNRETVTFSDKRVYYPEFSKKVKDILGVYKNGASVEFRLFPLYVEADLEGGAEVSYLYHSDELALGDSVLLPPQYTAFVLANGIASEYFYRSGLTDEAVFYKNRYDTAILNLSRRRQSITLKAGRM